MEKLREAFEKRAINMSYDLTMKNDNYTNINTIELYLGYLMCDADNTDIPKHETVEQWEERTGETYPDDGPVWFDYTSGYRCNIYAVAMKMFNAPKSSCTVANHHGKPDSVGER